MKNRERNPWMASLALGCFSLIPCLLLTACATVTRESVMMHETVLLETPSQLGRISESQKNVIWEADPGMFMLTPTGLHFVDSGSAYHSISYRDITEFVILESEERAGMPEFPFSKRVTYRSAIEIKTGKFLGDWESYTYAFASAETAQTVFDIIAAQKPKLDMFGRTDGPRPFWISNILRTRPNALTWAPVPEYLKEHNPTTITEIESLLESKDKELGRRLDDRVLLQLKEMLATEHPSSGWSPRSATNENDSRLDNPESSAAAKALLEMDASVSASVVTRNLLQFKERIDTDLQVSLELIVQMRVVFDNVGPPYYSLKTVRLEHSAVHSENAWLNQGSLLLDREIDLAAKLLARTIIDHLTQQVTQIKAL